MKQTDARQDASSTGCTLALIGVLLVDLALLVLGWGVTGTLCLFAVFALSLVRILQRRQVDWLFGDRPLRRERHPLGYGSFVLLYAVLSALSLWRLVEEFRAPAG
ncbi:MAG: hypothetical protein ACXWU2_15585 [Allosphingosinicella sp.]